MRKIIILILCCGMLVSMVGCGGNTTPPPTDSLTTTVPETVIAEMPPITAVEPTKKEKEHIPTESKEQVTEETVSTPITTKKPTEETKNFETPNASKEKENSQTIETTSSIASQHTESVITVTKPAEEIPPEPETTPSEIDIHYWISFAKEYAISIGLSLDSAAIDCWDNPIGANSRCIYLERDIKSRLNRYAKDEDITDVWIWTETTGNSCCDIYIGYA